MTVNTTSTYLLRTAAAPPLPPELLDGITEALMASTGAAARSDVISRLTHEMLDSIAWLHSNAEDDEELAGVLQVVEAADAHLGRMADRLGRRLTTEREAS